MRVTSKGQVTIPRWLRDKAGITPGCQVEFYEDNGRFCLRKTKDGGRGRLLVEHISGRGRIGMTTDEILALTRGKR